MPAQLYGIATWDPWSLSIATLALGTCALVAAIIPATRASATDPIAALRTE